MVPSASASAGQAPVARNDAPRAGLHLPLVQKVRSFPILRTVCRTVAAFRFSPIFSPRESYSRWRSHRAMRAAARVAKEKEKKRDWQKKFRLNGLTWHHLYISQDLRRIESFLRELGRKLEGDSGAGAFANKSISPVACGSTVVRLERAYAFLLSNIFDVYNSLEKNVFFPWIVHGVPENGPLTRALSLFANERERLEDKADIIQTRFARLVCSTGFPYSSMGPCESSRSFSASRIRRDKRRREANDAQADVAALNGEKDAHEEALQRRRSNLFVRLGFIPEPMHEERTSKGKKPAIGPCLSPTSNVNWRKVSSEDVRQLQSDLHTLIVDTEGLHRTERSLLYPIIAKTFPNNEQDRLTNVMVYSLRSNLAKLLIVVYHQAVEKSASRSQWKFYKREVPLPIRMYTPVWRARLYDKSPLGWLRSTPTRAAGKATITVP